MARPVTETSEREERYIVSRPVYEAAERENRYIVQRPVMETAERVFSRGFDKMKLYFIIGLPTEEDEDVLGIASVGANALQVGKRVGGRPKVTVSVAWVPLSPGRLQLPARDVMIGQHRAVCGDYYS